MAVFLSRPLALVGIKDGRPVFNTPQPRRTATAAQGSTPKPLPARRAAPPAAAPATPAVAAPPVKALAPEWRRTVPGLKNKYPGHCLYCQKWVAAEEGGRARDANGKWHPAHDYDCLTKANPREPAERPKKVELKPERPVSVLADDGESLTGYYTVLLGGDDYITVRVRRQPRTASYKPGRVAFAYLFGRNNVGNEYANFASADSGGRVWLNSDLQYKPETRQKLVRAIGAIVEDPKAAGEAWAKEFEACWICGRPLSTPESMAKLIGPDCEKKNR